MASETLQTPSHTPKLKILEEPYLKVKIDTTDHDNVIFTKMIDWARTANISIYPFRDIQTAGLSSNASASTVDLTKSITLPSNGFYQIEIYTHFHPNYKGGFTLYDGSTQIEDYKPAYQPYGHWGYVTYQPRYYTSGSHNFKISIKRDGHAVFMIIRPLISYTGDNQENTWKHTHRLDFNSLDFTQNSVGELNTATLTMPMHEEYYRDTDWYSPYVFDYNDIITIWLGETRRTSKAVFGGYVTRLSYGGEDLEVEAVDRLLDLEREPLYQNFSIGGVAAPEGSTRPFTSFPSVYELSRYLAEGALYPLKSYQIPYDFAVNQNYSTITEYNLTSVSTWNKYYDTKHGNPNTSLKLSIGNSTGTGNATLYESSTDPYDAFTYNYFSLDYYASGSGSRYPLPWNIIINMHKYGETSASAVDYTIQVGDGSGDNPLHSYSPVFDGNWQRLTVDLKKLFDKLVPSSEYNINSIKLQGTVTSTQLASRKCSAVWIGGLYCYKEINHASQYASQDVKTPLEELQQLCERTNHAAYVDYGDIREDDVLVVSPTKYSTASVAVDEDDNLLELESTDYDPLGDEFCNYRHMTFNFADNHNGSSQDWDWDSIIHYREKQVHDFNSDVKSQADADKEVDNYLTERKWPTFGFSVKIKGTPLLLPEQYAVVSIPSHRINGSYAVKSITHNYDSGSYTTNVDFGKASRRFRRLINSHTRELKNLGHKNQAVDYQAGVNNALGGLSPGAFTGGM